MGKKERARSDPAAIEPDRLRKALHKAEGRLEKARAKRDRQQARVEALGIIADELRAQLAEAERPGKPNGATTPGATNGHAKPEANAVTEDGDSPRKRSPARRSRSASGLSPGGGTSPASSRRRGAKSSS